MMEWTFSEVVRIVADVNVINCYTRTPLHHI